jgi:hypothetical protein
MARGDFASHPLRAERPFRLLVEARDGERALEADVVLDASGVFGQPVALGVPGERAAAPRILRDLGTLDQRRAELAEKCVLLVGHGHSAANAIAALERIARESATHVTWAVRSANARPCVEVADDPLPERARVAAHANALAAAPPSWLTVERRASIESIADDRVTLSGGRVVACDRIVSLVGYRPDLAILSDLAVEISPVTEGAARLARALSSITDCLAIPALTPRDLDSGEPNFHLVGAKSYGRSPAFLLRTALNQLATIFASLPPP